MFHSTLAKLQQAYNHLDARPRGKALQILADLGFEFHETEMDPDVCSAIVPVGMDLAVTVNSQHPESRQTFSLGHELCHITVHRGWEAPIYSRHSLRKTQAERQANSFSARLLMPSYLMQQLAKNHTRADELAQALGLSTEAVTYRLLELGHWTEDLAWFYEDVPF